MNERTRPPAKNTATTPPLSIHADFIKKQLPDWLTRAPARLRSALRQAMLKSNQSRHDVKSLLGRLQSPQDYARPLLQRTIDLKFFGLLDDQNSLLVREWKNHHLLGLIRTHTKTTQQTLLEAALQNFEASEAEDDGMEAGSALYTLTDSGRIKSPISPILFAGLCRNLDIGGHYLKHIDQILADTNAQAQLRDHAQNSFEAALHIAFLKGEIDAALYQQLLILQRDAHHPDILCNHLTIDGVELVDVLVIRDRQFDRDQILYTPDDPIAAFRRHPSMQDLEIQLAQRLEIPHYQKFFSRFVPLRHQGSLLTVRPSRIDWYSTGATGVTREVTPIGLEQALTLTPIQGDLFQAITNQRIAQIKNDARTLAVPTADADSVSRQKRLQDYEDIGKSLLFFVASFIPVVGEVLLVVTAAQLVYTVYNGFAAWSRGDSDQALNDLMDVVDNVFLSAISAGALKTSGFTANLVKVRLRDQDWRLWNPTLAPYRHPKKLPDSVPANAQGLYEYEQQHYVKLDDHAHVIKLDGPSRQWQVQHPTDGDAYTPPLLNNGVGAWRHVHETSRHWDDFKLIKRLGPDAANIKQPAVESILLISGADSSTLRQAHQQALRPPPLLRDTVKRFNLQQEIQDFNLPRAEGTELTEHSPFIQFYLVCALPQWPAGRILKVVDEQHRTLVSHGTQGTEIRVPESRFRRGELLHCLEQQLPASEFNELLPTLSLPHLSKVENLAMRLSEDLLQHQRALFAWLNERYEKPVTPIEQDIHLITPQLSKSHLEEVVAVLSREEQQRIHLERSLSAPQHWEVDQYLRQSKASRALEGLVLDISCTSESLIMMLSTLEQLPGWPSSRRIEVRDQSMEGTLLYSAGADNAAICHTLTREGELYTARDTEGKALHEPTDLFSAIAHALPETQLQELLRQSACSSLKQAVREASLALLAKSPPPERAPLSWSTAAATKNLAFDPVFADPTPPEGLILRDDGIYQAPALPDGSFRYYVQENARYYQVKAHPMGWRLLDARSRFRGYQPYIVKKAMGGWCIDEVKDSLLGGRPVRSFITRADTSSSEDFESAISSSEYDSAEESTAVRLYTHQELRSMRNEKSYQHSRNYLRHYDRANNGRYPLRDVDGQPLRIKFIQAVGKSGSGEFTLGKKLVMPYIQWQGYEKVARLYDEKIEVCPFTAQHQKFAEEASLIGQSTVITRQAVRKGDILGVYGGELIPSYVANYRQDPYLIEIRPTHMPLPGKGSSNSRAINRDVVFSGDNVLSRINTIFEYEAGLPVRQASTGYNVEPVYFDVDAQKDSQALERMRLTAFFAREDLAVGTELRWNYGYSEYTVTKMFGAPQAGTSKQP